ncbi:hypothetical protein [Flavobacterium sp. GCM10023249]|uniref:hypothetical protein n=1 Tax=unclassified Flavobacterium TaxID=196869 RepID=UPI00360F7C83
MKKNTYHHRVYNKRNSLIYKGSGSWKSADGFILLENFLINDNNVSEEFNYDETDLMGASFPVSSGIGNTEFIINPDTGVKYIKVK